MNSIRLHFLKEYDIFSKNIIIIIIEYLLSWSLNLYEKLNFKYLNPIYSQIGYFYNFKWRLYLIF